MQIHFFFTFVADHFVLFSRNKFLRLMNFDTSIGKIRFCKICAFKAHVYIYKGTLLKDKLKLILIFDIILDMLIQRKRLFSPPQTAANQMQAFHVAHCYNHKEEKRDLHSGLSIDMFLYRLLIHFLQAVRDEELLFTVFLFTRRINN